MMGGNNYHRKWSFENIVIVLKIYFFALVVFSIFRVVLFFSQIDKLEPSTSITTVLEAFLMGVRFDTTISAYILIFVYLLLTINAFLSRSSRVITHLTFWFSFIVFAIAFIVSGADIPYFDQFFSRFSITAFEWMDNPFFVFGMIVEEPRLWLYILPVAVLLYFLYKFLDHTICRKAKPHVPIRNAVPIIASFLFFGILFIGIRGRIDEKSPIRVGTAYFSNDALLNQLGLNPNFTLMKSFLENKKTENKPIDLMPVQLALAHTQQFLDIIPTDGFFPLYRKENEDAAQPHYKNVVLILMESMAAEKMERHGNKDKLTPFLDSLSNEGYYFENTFSAGIHTFNGIFSTLFSYPALFRKHPMKGAIIPKLHGMGSALREHDYTTVYFTTHDGQFDNVEGFLRVNGFDRVYSKKDYPAAEIKTTLGVPDDVMFSLAMPVLDDLSESGKPFFVTFMTASDHKPYYVPPYFEPKSEEISKQIVEYADFSLRSFITAASKKNWFENTLFVFVADHGAAMSVHYDIPLSYHHIPLLFYAPGFITEPAAFNKMAGQIDVFPSVMGLLQLPFENYTLGINLFEKERPYIYFNGNDKYGVINHDWLLVVRDENTGLYRYNDLDLNDYALEFPQLVDEMRTYASSQMQAYQYVLQNDIQPWRFRARVENN